MRPRMNPGRWLHDVVEVIVGNYFPTIRIRMPSITKGIAAAHIASRANVDSMAMNTSHAIRTSITLRDE